MHRTFSFEKNTNWHKPSLMSFFHGVGGMVIGAERAGFNHVYASDFWRASQKFHDRNHKDGIFQFADFWELSFDDIVGYCKAHGVDIIPGETDLVMAGTPCSGWSKANRNRYTFDRRNFLMIKQIRLACRDIKAKVLCLEQVPGFFDRQMLSARMEVFAALNAQTDYTWSIKVLNSVDYGANQSRLRLIVIMVRKDVGVPSFPEPQPMDVQSICLSSLLPGITEFRMDSDKPKFYDATKHPIRTLTATGGELVKDVNGWRALTSAEKIKICHMEDFDFTGFSDKEVTKLLGNMVQIPFAEALAKHVIDNILPQQINRAAQNIAA